MIEFDAKDCFFVKGRGWVVTGPHPKESVEVGDTVTVKEKDYVVTGIERIRTTAGTIKNIGLLLRTDKKPL